MKKLNVRDWLGGVALDISLESPAADNAFATIPAVLTSRRTLLYVGLSEVEATELWNRGTNWTAYGPSRETGADDETLQVTFIDFILGPLENQVRIAGDDDLQWRACVRY
jgi:hypothetical protein